MAVGETTVALVGTVTSDLARRRVSTGDDVTSFWVVSHERRFDRDTGEWVDGRQLSVRVSCWRRLADNVQVSLGKGDPVIVTGRLYTSEFDGADGGRRTITELDAYAVGPNLGRCATVVQRHRRDGPPASDPGPPKATDRAAPAPAAV
ncbi:single-strand DNA-binding protein [Amycolatopsis arida]|uniref:Single-stranded DNA-binding protein n=1 Tax=Amycolatopsis arida TaxID=587909 RepID=A0A1I5UKZ1_9PSEU|nr:single-stranded DNA-binding protein [Amycolatopsis arida]TDX90936.1 single-strand DNA-binding protein [Amycolatopsis arida]SFP95981.1 single-strand DNA-binding protein [Amycolatopsis arida]